MRAVDVLIAPSAALATACGANGMPTVCINNPLVRGAHAPVVASVTRGRKRGNFLYYGLVAPNKGVSVLLDALEALLVERPDIELVIAGRIEPAYEPEFRLRLRGLPAARYIGELDGAGVMGVLGESWCVVVPSLWLENYPNTVLEAMATGALVLGSGRGGIPELIRDVRCLFDPTNVASVANSMRWACDLGVREYEDIVEGNRAFIASNNGIELFYERILSVFKQAREIQRML